MAGAAISSATGSPPIRGLRVVKPSGAFYLFIDVSDVLSERLPDLRRPRAGAARQGARRPDRRRGVRRSGYLRISYAASLDRLQEGATRILQFVRAHAGAVV